MKIFVAALAFLIILGTVGLSVYLQNSTSAEMLEHLELCADDTAEKDMPRLYGDFAAFSEYYDDKRPLLALFVHTSQIEELDRLKAEVEASLENGEDNADDTDFDTVASSVKKLIDVARHIIETNTLSPGNIL